MKKFILAMVFAGSLSATYAQQPPIPSDIQSSEMPEFKSWLVYGDFGYNYQNNDNTINSQKAVTTNWSINPGIGYRLNEHFMVGLQGGMNYYKTKISYTGSTFTDDNMTDVWTLGAFVRHTCCDFGKIFYCYSQLNVSYIGLDAYPNVYYFNSNYNNTTGDQITNGYGVQATWFPVLGVHLPHSYSLTFNIGGISYDRILHNYGNNGTNSNFNVTFFQQVKIGFSKEFNCRRRNDTRSYREPGEELHRRNLEKMSGDDEDGSRRDSPRKLHDMDDE